MEAKIFKVVSKTPVITINAAGKEMPKCTVVLQELDRYGNTFVASMLGEETQKIIANGDLVAAVLKFSVREFEGRNYQYILVLAIEKIGNALRF